MLFRFQSKVVNNTIHVCIFRAFRLYHQLDSLFWRTEYILDSL